MIFYHFTDEASAEKILKEGLTKGMIFSDRNKSLLSPFQWLTKESKLSDNSPLYKGYRNVRLAVDIDKNDPKLLPYKKWLQIIEEVCYPETIKDFTYPCCRKWAVYNGTIPAERIRKG